MNVSPKELAETRDITTVLKSIPSWRRRALEAMRFSDNPVVKKFLARYQQIPSGDRNYLPFEAIALAADVEPAYLLGEILLAMSEFSVASVKVIGINRHPEVMKKTVERALEDEGFREREMVHSMLGALPQKSGSIFIGKFFGSKAEAPDESSVPEKFEDDVDVIFPDITQMQERVQPMRQKLLETRK